MAKIDFSPLSLLFSTTDEQAMWRVKMKDDHRAFAQLVARWEEPIRRLCARMTGDPHRGEDLKQEAFARVFDKRKDYQMTGRFSTWLWRIALNLCHDELRRRNRRKEFSLDGMEGEDGPSLEMMAVDDVTPDSRVVAQEEGLLVRQALLRLPEIYRAVLVLRHYEALKISKIAEVLEIPEGTVNSRLAEALARLSRLLEPQLAQERAPRTDSRKQIQPKELLVI